MNTSYSSGTANVESYGDTQYKYTISGLLPGTLYYYQVDGIGDGSFRAAPDGAAANVKLLAFSDPQGYPDGHDAACARMTDVFTRDPSFQTLSICAGDRADEDTEAIWTEQFFNRSWPNIPYFQARMPVAGPRGNHEAEGIVFRKYYPYPYVSDFYWSFDYGPVHIAVVDQTIDYAPGSLQHDWLANDLATTTKAWKIVTFHQPGWSAGNVHENNLEVQQYIQPLCRQYGVDLVISGHNHYYARAVVDGVHHLTTGGASNYFSDPAGGEYIVAKEGAYHHMEIDIQGRGAVVTARRRDDTVIESFTVSHGPSVRITSPQDNATLLAGQPTNVQATALPAGGTCSAVRFFADGHLIGTDETEPYAVSWTPALSSTAVLLTAEADVFYAGSTETVTSVPVTVNLTTAPLPESFSVRVSAGTDDAEQFKASGWMYLDSSDLELVRDSDDQIVGMRFSGVPLPPGATILQSYVQFTVDEISDGSCSLVIKGQAADNAATFTSAYYNISGRPMTLAAVSWLPAAWSTVGSAGQDQRTPDLSAILKEIINRPGWQLGNSLALVVTGAGTRTAVAYETSPAQAPRLSVTYSIPPPSNQAPTVNAGSDQTITLPNSAALAGTATDDGKPNPPGTLPISWSKLSGPGTVACGCQRVDDNGRLFNLGHLRPSTHRIRQRAFIQ